MLFLAARPIGGATVRKRDWDGVLLLGNIDNDQFTPGRVVFINHRYSAGVLLHGIDHGPYEDERHKERA